MIKTKAAIAAKIETTYGVDAVPVPASNNAILAGDLEVTAVSRSLDRNYTKHVYGSKDKLIIGEGLKISFSTELRCNPAWPAPNPTEPPDIGPLFRACNLSQTIVTTTGLECVKYLPNSSQEGESITIYYYQDGMLFKALGCTGKPSMEVKTNEYSTIKWEFTGLYGGPVTNTFPAAFTYSRATPPRLYSAAFTIDSYAAVIDSFKLSIENDIAKRPSANEATGILRWFVKGRAVTAEIDPEVPAIAIKDLWNIWATSTSVPVSITIGQAVGARCVITMPNVQIDELKFAERENILTYQLPLVVKPTIAGNDEIEFKFN